MQLLEFVTGLPDVLLVLLQWYKIEILGETGILSTLNLRNILAYAVLPCRQVGQVWLMGGFHQAITVWRVMLARSRYGLPILRSGDVLDRA